MKLEETKGIFFGNTGDITLQVDSTAQFVPSVQSKHLADL